MTTANLHTHTNYCDGRDSVAAVARAAYERGLGTLGFSEHSYTPQIAEFPGLAPVRFAAYAADVLAARAEYAGKMQIYLGLEQDVLSPAPPDGLDYLIGSVHTFEINGEFLSVDESEARQREAVKTLYGGDFYGLIRDYYAAEASVIAVTGANIIGHFDLVCKFNEGGRLFDENDPRYISAAFEALDALIDTGAIFEINTGAMSRGYRSSPYPARPLLRRIFERGGRVTVSTDSHSAETIDYAFDAACRYAYDAGFRELWTLGKNGFFETPLLF